jgi:hypothetical protein
MPHLPTAHAAYRTLSYNRRDPREGAAIIVDDGMRDARFHCASRARIARTDQRNLVEAAWSIGI